MPLFNIFRSKVKKEELPSNPVDPPTTPGTNLKIRDLGKFGSDDDETPISYNKLNDVYLSDSTTFNEINEIAFIVSRDFTVVSQFGDDENNEGVTAINDWIRTYNMRPKIRKYMEELARDRRFGTSYGELVTLRNKLINNGNPITVDMVTISPHTVSESSMKRDKYGRLIHFEQMGENSIVWDGLKDCANIQVIKWNENTYSKTGVSHLVPAYYDIKNYKDFRLYIMEIFKKDVRPIVEHTLISEGLSDKQVKAYFSEYQDMLNTTRAKKLFDIFKTDKWTTEIKGFQGKMLDNSTLLKILDIHRREALRFPNMASGEGTNKATMEVQKRHLDQTKVKSIEQKLISEAIEPLFKRVLAEMGINAPVPTIEQAFLQALDVVAQAQSDMYNFQILGPQYASIVAERMGIQNYDADWKMKEAEKMAKFNKPVSKEGEGNELSKDGFSQGKETRTE